MGTKVIEAGSRAPGPMRLPFSTPPTYCYLTEAMHDDAGEEMRVDCWIGIIGLVS